MDRGRRIACVWLPRFALAVAAGLARHSSLITQHSALALLALYRPGTRWQELLECSPDLEAAGVRPGLALKEAQARFPNATFLPCDDATLDAVARAFEVVVEALDAFSPIVEPAPRELLGENRAVAYLDAAGLAPLYGPDAQLATRLATAASSALESVNPSFGGVLPTPRTNGGVGNPAPALQPPNARRTQHSALSTQHSSARVGVAASKFVAWVAASLAGQFTADERTMVVPPGEEATFLAPLPLETLSLPLRDRLALQRLGVRTLGEFARLPANAVQHRYGAAGSHAHRLAQGLDDAPLRPRPPRPAARVELTFDWEETELDRLVFALKILSDQLAVRLASLTDGVAAGEEYEPDEEAWPEDGTSGRAEPAQESGFRKYAAEALRLTWRLEGGEEREILLRLAEPAATSAAFLEHLRWHAEGLDRFLAPALSLIAKKGEPFLQNEFPSPDTAADRPSALLRPLALLPCHSERSEESAATASVPELTYQPLEQRVAVRGIALEAVGIQVPGGIQLKLLASPLQLANAGGAATARLDPVQRAQHARRAIARLQARWEGASSHGEPSVWQAALTDFRLPERLFHRTQPQLGFQVEDLALPPPLHPDGEGVVRPSGGRRYVPTPSEMERGGERQRRRGEVSPLTIHPPFWLVDPPAPVLLLRPRREGGRPILSLATGKGRSRRELRIVRRGGPWKLVDPTRLTSSEPLARDYYQVETDDGRAYLIFRDPTADAWFLQGIFD